MREHVLYVPKKESLEKNIFDILKRQSEEVISFVYPISNEKKKATIFHHSTGTTLLMTPINENPVFEYEVMAYGKRENIENLKNQIDEYRGLLVRATPQASISHHR